jgi:hypothetical protein
MDSMRFEPTNGQPTPEPPILPGTSGGLLLPRTGLEVAAVQAPLSTTLRSTALDGDWLSEIRIDQGDYHVLPQVGYHYAVNPHDVQVGGATNSAATYLLGDKAEVTTERTMVPVLAQFWRERRQGETPVHAMYTIVAVHVLGEIDPAATGVLYTNCGKFRLGPGLAPSPRQLLLAEQTGNNVRVVPDTFVVRQFAYWIKAGGEIREQFELRQFP